MEQLSRLRNNLNPLYQSFDTPPPSFHRIPGAPPLLPGEAFSSWHWRIQTFLKVPTRTLQSALGITAPPYLVDTGACSLDLERIAYTVMQTTTHLETLTRPQKSLLSNPRYLNLTTIPLRRRPIFRYCEICLRNDPTPYIRQLWRVACIYLCPTHGTVLRELCPKCHQRFELPSYTLSQANLPLRLCRACGADICDVKPCVPPAQVRYLVLARQAELLQLISAESRLMEAWSDLQTHNIFHVGSQTSGFIDTDSDEVLRMLFARILSSHLTQTQQPHKQCIHTLDNYLRMIPVHSADGQTSEMPVAFDGLQVFGKHAITIGFQLLERQDLWGSTHWWPLEHARFMMNGEIFKTGDFEKAPEWSNKLARLAKNKK